MPGWRWLCYYRNHITFTWLPQLCSSRLEFKFSLSVSVQFNSMDIGWIIRSKNIFPPTSWSPFIRRQIENGCVSELASISSSSLMSFISSWYEICTYFVAKFLGLPKVKKILVMFLISFTGALKKSLSHSQIREDLVNLGRYLENISIWLVQSIEELHVPVQVSVNSILRFSKLWGYKNF